MERRRRTLGVLDAPIPPRGAERYTAMEKSIGNVVAFPAEVSRDVLTEVLREGARRMLAAAIEAEVQGYLAAREQLVDDAGHRVVVRNGHLPARNLQTPLGEVSVQQPRVRDRRPATDREPFQSS